MFFFFFCKTNIFASPIYIYYKLYEYEKKNIFIYIFIINKYDLSTRLNANAI